MTPSLRRALSSPAMAAPLPGSLDVPELQVLVRYPDDAGGFVWHHRLPLQRLSVGRFVCAIPDLEVQVVDLNEQLPVPLVRACQFSADYANQVYASDLLRPAELTTLRRTAAAYMALFGGAEATADDSGWLVCGTRYDCLVR